MYEGFDYTDFDATTTPNASTIGLNQSIAYAGTAPGNLNIGTGLTLSNLTVTGGSASFSGGTIVAGAQLALSAPYTGTLYGSYLVNLSGRGTGGGDGAEVRLADNDSTLNNRFRALADSRNGTTTVVGNSYDGTMTDASTSLTANTTYIMISRFLNVGTTLTDPENQGVATTWALTAAQFDNFRAQPDPEAFLGSASIGGGAGQLTARVTDTSPATATGPFTFATGNRMQFVEVNDTGRVDEIRYGTTLADVIVPEPASLGVLGLGAAALLARRRERRDGRA